MDGTLEFRVLGPVEARRDSVPLPLGGNRQRALLAVLLLHAGEVVPSARLIDDLFGESASDGSANALQQAVSRLRRALGGDDTLVTKPGGYELRIDPDRLDLHRFERLSREARELRANGQHAAAADRFRTALALWRGPPLADVVDFEFAQTEIRRLEELRVSALIDRIDADLASGDGAGLVGELEALVAANPYQERLRAQLILALYRSGRQADALEELRRTRTVLRTELGLEPSRSLQDLERAILVQDAALDAIHFAATSQSRPVCPFKGLASFDIGDARFFCGRERIVDDLVARLAETSLVGVVGPSGVGKSSVIRAGLLDALAAEALPGSSGWPAVVVRPGRHPVAELERALDSTVAERRRVIAVDQLEELFTVCEDEGERTEFLERVVGLGTDPDRETVVALALRADFYGRCSVYPEFARLLQGSHVLVGPMREDDLERAISIPAGRAGLEVEPALVRTLVDDVAGEPGGLPLLSTALLELWRRRDGSVLRLSDYREAGGVRGAVGRLAEATYGSLDDEGRETARTLMLRLAAGDADNAVRRRVPASDLTADRPGADGVLRRLVDARMLTTDEGSVEVAHEALLREWPRMRGWLEEERQSRRVEAHVRAAAAEWDAGGHDPADLYRGLRLSAVLDWQDGHPGDLGPVEREFVAESRLASDRELVAQKRRFRRLVVLAVAIFGLLVLALVAGGAALVQRSSARREARAALARQLGAEALAEPRIDRAMLLAREAVALSPSSDTSGTLLATLLRTPAAIATFTSPITARPQKLSVSPDGRTLGVADNTNGSRFFDLRDRTLRATVADFGYGTAPIFTPDGTRVVDFGGVASAQLVVRDARTFRKLRVLALDPHFYSGPNTLVDPVFTPGGTLTFVYALARPDGSDGSAFLDRWDLRTGRRTVTARLLGVQGANALRSVGNRLLLAADRFVLVLDSRTLHELRRLPISPGTSSPGPAPRSALSPDGRTLATVEDDGRIELFGVAGSGITVRSSLLAPAGVNAIAFSGDGRLLAVGGLDGSVGVWDSSGARLDTFTGHSTRVLGLAFDGSGQTLYSCSLDGAIFAWDLGSSRRFGSPFVAASGADTVNGPDETSTTPPLALSPDGSRFAVRKSRSEVAFFDTATPTEKTDLRVRTGGEVGAVAWSRNNLLAVSGSSGHIQVWSVAGQPRLARSLRGLGSTTGFPESVTTLAFSPDGSLLAAGDVNHTAPAVQWRYGTAAVWDVRSGRLLWRARSRRGWVTSVALSPDGKTVAAADESGTVVLYAARTGRVERTLHPKGITGFAAAAYAPNGTLATGTWSGIVQLWNPGTGREIGKPTLVAAAPVASIAFGPTGSSFATAGASDGFAKLWTTGTLRQFGSALPGPLGPWGHAQFTPDGTRLVVVWDDGTGTVWPASVEAWQQHACAVAGRNFTREEWLQYVGNAAAYRPTCQPPVSVP